MSNLQFPKTVRAAKANDLTQWAMGDALVQETKDGGETMMIAVSHELEENGIKHGTRYLYILRQTAQNFPPDRRHDGIPLLSHWAAGSPDTLDVVAKAGRKEGKPVTREFISDVLRSMREQASEKAREEREAAAKEEAKAAEEESKAQTTAQRQAARAKRNKARDKRKAAKSPRRKDLPAPDEKDVNPFAAKAQFMKKANEARSLANKALKLIKPNLDEYSPAAIAGLTDACLTVANTWREIGSVLANIAKKSGKGLLSVVNE